MIKLLKNIFKNIENSILKKKYIGKEVVFHKNTIIDSNCFFRGNNSIGSNSILKNSYLDQGSYVGRNNELSSVKIGKFCSIGSFIINTTGRHPTSKFVSTHPSFFSKGKAAGFTFTDKNKFEELKYAEDNYLVSIGNDVWIGDRVTLLDGIKIGDGAIIGCNSLVTKDVEPYTINVGTPARPIKKRFSNEEISFLLEFGWWNKDFEWLKTNSDKFQDINDLINFTKHE
jgi:acetyltransferase-like isoleucine patch superfamily enzyme